jgi:4-hydroxy-2-oxoheptanedioate aldolase
MYPHPNPLKVKLAADQPILGLFVQSPSPDTVEMAAAAGFDYVIIDEEHGSFGMTETVAMIRAAEASGVCPIVRVPDHGAANLRRAAEAGALGVYVPDIRSAKEAEAAVAAIKFKAGDNGGRRGACPTVRSARPGSVDWRRYVEWSNDNVMVCLLVESQEGLDDLDAILAVPGIDTIILGRFDLWHEKGLGGDRYNSEINAVFETFAAKARKAGVPYVARLKSLEPGPAGSEFQEAVRQGARIFNLASDRQLIYRAFSQVTAPLRAAR